MRRVAAGLIAMLAACAPAPAPKTELVPLTAELRGAYLGYWSAWETASGTSDGTALSGHVGQPLLDTLRANLDVARGRSQVSRGTVGHRTLGVRPAVADGHGVVDCVDLDRWLLYDARTGALLDQLVDKPSQLTRTVLRRQDGVWKATSLYLEGDC